jgi:hypothetical protein
MEKKNAETQSFLPKNMGFEDLVKEILPSTASPHLPSAFASVEEKW